MAKIKPEPKNSTNEIQNEIDPKADINTNLKAKKQKKYKEGDNRYHILMALGKEAQKRYNKNMLEGAGNYNLSKLQNTLKFIPNLQTFENEYYLEGDSEEQTRIAYYFEYGTGLFNTRSRKKYITPINFEHMKWKDKKSGKMIFAKRTKGVRPVFAMTKAVLSIKYDLDYLLPKIEKKLGI
jgi:hypothetical protein